ncbi:MAG TPA: methyltransferase domain-containing protein, partial [Longimicrobiales bacterium]
SLPYPDGAFHAVLLTLTLHHFEGEAALRVLRELARVARGGMIVSDLDRSWANYVGARLLGWTVWARNPITRHDGPLSVLRAYTADELRQMARDAGLRDARVVTHPFQRVVLLARGRGS